MPLDYAIMFAAGVIGVVIGLITLREAKKYRARRDREGIENGN